MATTEGFPSIGHAAVSLQHGWDFFEATAGFQDPMSFRKQSKWWWCWDAFWVWFFFFFLPFRIQNLTQSHTCSEFVRTNELALFSVWVDAICVVCYVCRVHLCMSCSPLWSTLAALLAATTTLTSSECCAGGFSSFSFLWSNTVDPLDGANGPRAEAKYSVWLASCWIIHYRMIDERLIQMQQVRK